MPDMSDPAAAEILRFWFEEHPKDWFVKNPAFDAEIRGRFLALHEAASAGRLAHWADDGRNCLALVIVLDQFPRNLFRGEARAFATDPLARAAARVILQHGWDRAMTRPEQLFAYLPFEHSESLEDQKLSCELMKEFEGSNCATRSGTGRSSNASAGFRTATPFWAAKVPPPRSNFSSNPAQDSEPSVIAPREAVETSFMYLARRPLV